MIGQFSNQIYLSQPQNNPICPSSPGNSYSFIQNWMQKDSSWCTFEVVDEGTAIVQQCYAATLLILLVFFIRRCYRLIQYRRMSDLHFGDFYVKIHVIIGLWFICTFIRVVLSIVTYYKEILSTSQISPDVNSPIVILAAIYTLFNFLCGYLVNLLILLIPFKWLNVCLFSIKEEEKLTYEFRKTIDSWFIVLRLVKVYIYVRLIFVLTLAIQPFIFFFPSIMFFVEDFSIFRCEIPLFNYFFMIGQSTVITLFQLFAGYALIRIHKLNLIKLSPQVYRKMRFQYFFLLLSIIGRVSVNIIRIVLYENSYYTPNQFCYDSSNETTFTLSLIVAFHHVLMHLVPVSVSLYIYRLTIQNRDKSQFYFNSDNHHSRRLTIKNGLGQNLCSGQNPSSKILSVYEEEISCQIGQSEQSVEGDSKGKGRG